MEAGTFLAAAAITGGDIILENVQEEHLKPVLAKLCGMQHQNGADGGGNTGLAKGQALRCAGKDHALSPAFRPICRHPL